MDDFFLGAGRDVDVVEVMRRCKVMRRICIRGRSECFAFMIFGDIYIFLKRVQWW